MMKRQLFLLCACLGLCSFGVAKGGFTYLSQERYVTASNDKGSEQSIIATDYAPFNTTATVIWTRPIDPEWRELPWWNPEAEGSNTYTATAKQISTLANGSITVEGYAEEFGPFYAFQEYTQSAMSYFETTFETTQPGRYTLDGVLVAFGDTGGTNIATLFAECQLSGVFDTKIGGIDQGEVSFHEVVYLEPGVYTLRATASAFDPYWGYVEEEGPYPGVGVGGGGEATYSVRLAPAVPAPGAILLGTIGAGLVGWMRRRRTL